jgi:hypothetical protein
MSRISLLLVVTLLVVGSDAFNPARYSNSKLLTHFFRLHWSVDESNDVIYLGLEANTTGWVGFGISESTSGSMPGSDVLMVSVDGTSQKATLFDGYFLVSFFSFARYTVGYVAPNQDSCQDWKLISASETSSKYFNNMQFKQ